MASTANVPLPWSGIASQPLACETPQSASSRSRTSRTAARKASSREPRSRSIACLTVRLVVSGPGVKSSLSRAGGTAGVGAGLGLLAIRASITFAAAGPPRTRPARLSWERRAPARLFLFSSIPWPAPLSITRTVREAEPGWSPALPDETSLKRLLPPLRNLLPMPGRSSLRRGAVTRNPIAATMQDPALCGVWSHEKRKALVATGADAPVVRRGFTLLELLIVLVVVSLCAATTVRWYFSHADVTLENAAILLVRDVRAAQHRSIFLGEKSRFVFLSDGSGYSVLGAAGQPARNPQTDEPFLRVYSNDGVFNGVSVLDVDAGGDRTLEIDGRGLPLEELTVTLAYRDERRTILLDRKSCEITIVGSTSGWTDDDR